MTWANKTSMLAKDMIGATFGSDPARYIASDAWCMQQKLDGERMIIDTRGDVVKCYNRNGVEKNIPPQLNLYSSEYLLDGEFLNGKYYAFDRPDLTSMKYIDRYNMLNKEFLSEYLGVEVLPIYLTQEDKQRKFEEFYSNNSEGVMFKRVDGMYKNGRSSSVLKYKFISDIDCIVIERPSNANPDKQNMYLGMYSNGEIVEVGKVSALTGDGPKLKIGDVCKISCLYVTKGGNLFQPVKPMLRVDKDPTECTIDQLDQLLTNKEVLV